MFDIIDEPIEILISNLRKGTEKRLAFAQSTQSWCKTSQHTRFIMEQLETHLIPITKQTFPKLFAHEIIGVQTACYNKDYCYNIRFKDQKYDVLLCNRNLATRWDFECIQNAFNNCGIDITNEVHTNLSNEIAAEIDYELVVSLLCFAKSSYRMEYTGTEPSCVGDENPRLGILISRQANLIHARLNRGGDSWCIVNNTALNILIKEHQKSQSLFVPCDNTKEKDSFNLVGHIGKIKVFYNVHANDEQPVLVGTKINDTDAAMIYVPYELIKSNGVIIDPQTFELVMNFGTHFGMFAKDTSDYLGLIDLPTKDLVYI